MICTIRPLKTEDANDLALALNNPNVLNNLRDGLPFPYTVSDAAAYIDSMLAADRSKTYSFAIAANQQFVGCIGAFRQENIHFKTAEMGYYIAESHWGKGVGTSAVKQACEFIFSNTDIIRIFAEPFAHNAASCRILEKAGFSYEGTLHKNAFKNGAFIDMKMYALVRD